MGAVWDGPVDVLHARDLHRSAGGIRIPCRCSDGCLPDARVLTSRSTLGLMGDSGGLIIGGRSQAASLRLAHEDADEYVTTIIATADDAGLNASIRVATSPGEGGLSAFLGELAENFCGWEGTRTWSSWGRELTASAVFRSRGHVAITWSLTRRFANEEDWRAEVTTVIEAGAEMSALASEVAAFIDAATDPA